MKAKRILSIFLALSVTASLCACKPKVTKETEPSKTDDSKHSGTSQTATEPSADPTDPTAPDDPIVAPTVKDESEDPILVYGYEKGFEDVVKTYLPDVEIEFVYFEINAYYLKLDEALKSENQEERPDLFMVDAEHLQEYSCSDLTLGINELGLSVADLGEQFTYTYQAASNGEGEIRGLSYELAPSAILYNRALAQETLGVNTPEDVSALMADWDGIIEAARSVNMNSEGVTKLLAGPEDIRRTFWAGHTATWINADQVQIDSFFDQYFLLEEILFAETLTFDKELHSAAWTAEIEDGHAMMFFGSLQTAAKTIGYVPGHEEDPNADGTDPSSGKQDPTEPTGEGTTDEEVTGWGLIAAPQASFDDGKWLMVSYSCDMKATAAKILKGLTLDEKTMTQMAVDGIFVNNRKLMHACAQDPNFVSDFLGGQNPYAILVPIAESITVVSDPQVDLYAQREIDNLLDAYLAGDIENMDEVKQQFIIGMQELLGLI
ncbi:MAG: extracellular solute-binding protein [Clostridiales bacterium]|nr:extracellular solute-binding protein [Clostridiales bacterium]